jgi:acetolactate decarboxylase
VYPVTDGMTTPFSAVTFFDADETLVFDEPMNLSVFEGRLEEDLPSQNLFYAIRIDGTFSYVKARSVPKQEEPYPRLSDAVAEQSIFEFHNTTGSLVGFWTPALAKGINVPGYHLHYITEGRTGGGHVLELEFERAEVMLDITPGFHMLLPTKGDFLAVDLGGDLGSDLEMVEK